LLDLRRSEPLFRNIHTKNNLPFYFSRHLLELCLFLPSSYQFVAAQSPCEKSLQNKLEHKLLLAWEEVAIAEKKNKAGCLNCLAEPFEASRKNDSD